MHKPEPMHYGRCPGECRRLRLCVLLHPDNDESKPREYFIRAHKCGRRLKPVKGTVAALSNVPESPASTLSTDSHRERK